MLGHHVSGDSPCIVDEDLDYFTFDQDEGDGIERDEHSDDNEDEDARLYPDVSRRLAA